MVVFNPTLLLFSGGLAPPPTAKTWLLFLGVFTLFLGVFGLLYLLFYLLRFGWLYLGLGDDIIVSNDSCSLSLWSEFNIAAANF